MSNAASTKAAGPQTMTRRARGVQRAPSPAGLGINAEKATAQTASTARNMSGEKPRTASINTHATATAASIAGELRARGRTRPASSYQERPAERYSMVNPANVVLHTGPHVDEERKPVRTPKKVARPVPQIGPKKPSGSIESPRTVAVQLRQAKNCMPANRIEHNSRREEEKPSPPEGSHNPYGRIRQVLKIENYSFDILKRTVNSFHSKDESEREALFRQR